MNDQTKPTDDPTLTALRERAKDIQAQIDSADPRGSTDNLNQEEYET